VRLCLREGSGGCPFWWGEDRSDVEVVKIAIDLVGLAADVVVNSRCFVVTCL
jgi:hypothetical protein